MVWLLAAVGALAAAGCAPSAPAPRPPSWAEQELRAQQWETWQRLQGATQGSRTGRVVQLEPLYFDTGRSRIRPDQRPALERNARRLHERPGTQVRIEGHCDERGHPEYNEILGQRRAEAVRAALIELGVDPQRLTAVSSGARQPTDPGRNAAAWARNRRVELHLITSKVLGSESSGTMAMPTSQDGLPAGIRRTQPPTHGSTDSLQDPLPTS